MTGTFDHERTQTAEIDGFVVDPQRIVPEGPMMSCITPPPCARQW